MTAHNPPPPSPDPCPQMRAYMERYIFHGYYPGRYHSERARWFRSMATIHAKHCPMCKRDYLRSNFNARQNGPLAYFMPKETQ